MFIVTLRFSDNKPKAGQFMADHNAWIAKGISDGVFLLVGSLQPQMGGAVIAHGVERSALEARVADDPFVRENVVTADILEISPSKVDPRLDFLLKNAG